MICFAGTLCPATAQVSDTVRYRFIPDTGFLRFLNTTAMMDPDFYGTLGQGGIAPIQLRSIKKYLPDSVTLLEYIPCRDSLFILFVNQDRASLAIVSVPRDTITAKVKQLLDAVSFQQVPSNLRPLAVRGLKVTAKEGKPYRSFAVLSDELYDILLGPVQPLLKGKKYISIAAYGSLANLPFQLLGQRGQDGQVDLAAQDLSFFYINDIETFRSISSRKQPVVKEISSIICFGNPDGTLPSAEKEVKAIRGIYPSTVVITGKKATADTLYKMNFHNTILHIATHGVIDMGDFNRSYLLFADLPGQPRSGRLMMQEIFGMDQLSEVRMVVMSACNTGVSLLSDSLMVGASMSMVMSRTGIRTVIASLWPVDDEATSKLMTKFYRNIAAMSVVEALRHAQATLSNDPQYTHPYFWGGFILVGDWR